ncbi:type II CRISPR-associated endonuclease Cas1 [Chitinophaga sp. sic0106]|uniref:type II CRISPR-associated endonuclease Cas1 n=1 Tax=Chitinophaga sp. sic0106 TaxID=2854785 RepID=UPI001C4501A6|nr:type II CRISPR-associated endonuclease Cas1 [Chitinophaga sp. sic0106]MBV7533002.1 type II CRISPR-associated endonuclease Cas1 [Chitinophaga sp. sic0106]
MIKRTLYFGNPAYLKTKDNQLIIELVSKGEQHTAVIEDLGVVILDHPQITITQAVIAKLLLHNVALITCDHSHHPAGLLLNLEGHTLQSQRFRHQLEATVPLKKQLWQQTVSAKVFNQYCLLQLQLVEGKLLLDYSKSVKSGDPDNIEAKAASFYWKNIFGSKNGFYRDRLGPPPNSLLNYGYAILRALVARCLVGSGLLPTVGIFHKNQYNAYCLADDVMEPYRPFVDRLVLRMHSDTEPAHILTPDLKRALLEIPVLDVSLDGSISPLAVAVQKTTASLAKCFDGSIRKILYPVFPDGDIK